MNITQREITNLLEGSELIDFSSSPDKFTALVLTELTAHKITNHFHHTNNTEVERTSKNFWLASVHTNPSAQPNPANV